MSSISLSRLKASLFNSLRGLQAVFINEASFRLEVYCTPLVIIAAVLLSRSVIAFALLVFVWLQVLVVELLNSAIEMVADRFGSERHVLIGYAKDYASAAVFLMIVFAALVWLGYIIHVYL